jgi:hypothetical protein
MSAYDFWQEPNDSGYEPNNREKRKNFGKEVRMKDGFNYDKVKGMKKKNKKRYIRQDE